MNNAGYKPWMVKMDPSGTVIWSTLIQHYNTGADPLEICDVVERLNTVANPNTYEYFGVAQTPDFSNNADKMTVWKLDDLGSNSASPNDFQYSLNTLSGQWTYNPTQIEIIGTGAAGDGIQVFGTDQSSTPSNVHILAGAYFNGSDGCESANDWTYHQGPSYSISPSLSTSNLSPCIYFTLTKVANTVTPSTGCSTWTNAINGGSNARGAATGIENYSENSKNVSIHPNPTNRNLTLTINGEVNGPVRITIINSLGQIEKKIEISNNVTNEFALDFEALQMNEGLYFINVTVNKETHTNKVMFKK